MKNSYIIWQGPSELDSAPVVLIAVGFATASTNAKTGAMIQTYILRQDSDPVASVHSGADSAICGQCPHRGQVEEGRNHGRTCYVQVGQAAYTVWHAYRRGSYPVAENPAELLAGRAVRMGSYGDPAAVPLSVWTQCMSRVRTHTGYTHQWMHSKFSGFREYCMASVDSEDQARQALAQGWRYYRVGAPGDLARVRGQESLCPASKEAGAVLNCEQCGACGGLRSPNQGSIYIPGHGNAAVKFYLTQRAQAEKRLTDQVLVV